MTRITVAVLNPGSAKWELREIENDYDSFYAIIEGPLEHVEIAPEASLYCHEEGKIIELPPCAAWMYHGKLHDILHGTLCLTGPADDDGYETSITEAGLAKAQEVLIPVVLL